MGKHLVREPNCKISNQSVTAALNLHLTVSHPATNWYWRNNSCQNLMGYGIVGPFPSSVNHFRAADWLWSYRTLPFIGQRLSGTGIAGLSFHQEGNSGEGNRIVEALFATQIFLYRLVGEPHHSLFRVQFYWQACKSRSSILYFILFTIFFFLVG